MRGTGFLLGLLAARVVYAANDWGMGEANSKLAPPHMFRPLSTPAHEISTLAIFTLAVTGAIFVIVAVLLAYSAIRFRARRTDDGSEPPQVYGSGPVEFAWTAVPVLIVFVLALTTGRTVYTIQAARRPQNALGVRVVGHQWWWEFQYPELGIVTANELHVPVSDPRDPRPTFLELESADVAHSFWVPQLAGKTDVIPNKTNVTWIEPESPGVFLGQCAEFCGTQHALMLLRVVVHPREEWERWVASQRAPAATDKSVENGRRVFASTACVNCHVVQGTGATGRFGPDLTHLMSRETLAAGAALNTPANLKAWLRDPNVIKPGALMPAMNLADRDLDDLVAYLETLR